MADIAGGQLGQQPTRNINNNNNNNDPLLNLRDGMFHTLFYRVSLAYARACPPPVRRTVEALVLVKAVLCFITLVWVNSIFYFFKIVCMVLPVLSIL